MVANAARWLGLLSFEDFEDRRNSDPLIHRPERDTTALEVGVSATFDAEPPSIDLTDSNTGEVDLSPTIVGNLAIQHEISPGDNDCRLDPDRTVAAAD